MAKFLCGNDLRVLRFISENQQVTRHNIALRFAASCDITHIVAGLRDRGLIRQFVNRQRSKYSYTITKDGLRQLAQVQQKAHTTS